MSQMGHIQVIYGPMFSGKSSQLLRKIRRYEHAKKKCLIINYQHDNRYSNNNQMATHDKQTAKALKTSSLKDNESIALEYDVVAIDQGQFFMQIVQFCEKLANSGVIVLVAGLDGTFQRKSFGNIINLLPIAQKIMKLSAICFNCGNEAAFSIRLIQSQEIELIGGEQSYQPACRQCFNQLNKIQQKKQQQRTKNILQNEKNKINQNKIELQDAQ